MNFRKVLVSFEDNDYHLSSLTGFRGALNANPKKFVNLDLSGSTFTDIENRAFFYGDDFFYREVGPPPGYGCKTLTGITIPNSVTGIGESAFLNCNNLTSVTFRGTIPSANFGDPAIFPSGFPFPGDLRDKFYATNKPNGTPGTYTTTNPGYTAVWTKQ